MDEYARIALLHFRRFEGAALYPSLLGWRWPLWFMLLGLFLWAAVDAFAPAHLAKDDWRVWRMLAAEVAFLLMCNAIAGYKRRRILAAHAQSQEASDSMSRARARSLEELLGIKASNFASTAKEVTDLLDLREQHRLASDFTWSHLMLMIYDPGSKARLLTVVLAALATFVALLTRTEPTSLANVLDVLFDKSALTLLMVLLLAAAVAFGLFWGVVFIMRLVLDVLRHRLIGLEIGEFRSDYAIRYMVRDLVLLHKPGARKEVRRTVRISKGKRSTRTE